MSNTASVSYKWGIKGEQPIIECKQNKRERQTVFGSYNYEIGQITINFANRGNTASFKQHLTKVLDTYKFAPKIIMVLDNVRYHHAKRLMQWLEKKSKLEFFFLPPYSPDLNAVERA